MIIWTIIVRWWRKQMKETEEWAANRSPDWFIEEDRDDSK